MGVGIKISWDQGVGDIVRASPSALAFGHAPSAQLRWKQRGAELLGGPLKLQLMLGGCDLSERD